jgi:hypothetical protein
VGSSSPIVCVCVDHKLCAPTLTALPQTYTLGAMHASLLRCQELWNLEKFLFLSEPQFPQLQNVNNKTFTFHATGWLQIIKLHPAQMTTSTGCFTTWWLPSGLGPSCGSQAQSTLVSLGWPWVAALDLNEL